MKTQKWLNSSVDNLQRGTGNILFLEFIKKKYISFTNLTCKSVCCEGLCYKGITCSQITLVRQEKAQCLRLRFWQTFCFRKKKALCLDGFGKSC